MYIKRLLKLRIVINIGLLVFPAMCIYTCMYAYVWLHVYMIYQLLFIYYVNAIILCYIIYIIYIHVYITYYIYILPDDRESVKLRVAINISLLVFPAISYHLKFLHIWHVYIYIYIYIYSYNSDKYVIWNITLWVSYNKVHNRNKKSRIKTS